MSSPSLNFEHILANTDENQIISERLDPVFNSRPVISTLDTWDQNTQLEYPFSAASIGRRPSWNVPSIAVTSESVNTIRSSAPTVTQSTTYANKAAMTLNPSNGDTMTWRVVPNMAQNLFVESNVQVTFTMLLQSTQPTSPRFCIFRDGQKLSQEYQQATQANIRSLVSGAYVDTGASLRKYHVYDLRWRPQNVPIQSFNNNRTFQASNLRAQ